MRIFLSYASEHRDVAEQIQVSLAGSGYSVFFDREDLPSAGDYDARIAAAVADSDLMLFLVSPASIAKGSYALTELKFARGKWPHPKGRVLPVLIEKVSFESMPPYLKAVTLLEPEGNVHAEVRAEVEKLAADLKRIASVPAGPVVEPQLLVGMGSASGSLGPARPAFGRALAAFGTGLGQKIRADFVTLPLALLCGVALALGLLVWTASPTTWPWLRSVISAGFSDGSQVQLTSGLRASVEAGKDALVPLVSADAQQTLPAVVTPWSLAQDVLALPREQAPGAVAATSYLRQNMTTPESACWTEVLNKSKDSCGIFISGWVLAALARLHVAATPAELHFLLDNQHADGWWAMFPINGEPAFASSYATAWALLGLYEQRKQGLVGEDQAKAVAQAIGKAQAWLLAARGKDAARWKTYPRQPGGDYSISVSGTVLHSLHRTGATNLKAIDQLWLEELPEDVVGKADNVYVVVPTTTGETVDHVQQIQLPWALIATVDAYPSGSTLQRAGALRWLEAQLDDPQVKAAAQKEERAWWRAELLMALRQVLK